MQCSLFRPTGLTSDRHTRQRLRGYSPTHRNCIASISAKGRNPVVWIANVAWDIQVTKSDWDFCTLFTVWHCFFDFHCSTRISCLLRCAAHAVNAAYLCRCAAAAGMLALWARQRSHLHPFKLCASICDRLGFMYQVLARGRNGQPGGFTPRRDSLVSDVALLSDVHLLRLTETAVTICTHSKPHHKDE